MEKLLYQLDDLKQKQRNRHFQSWTNKKTDNEPDALVNKDVINNYIYELKNFLNYNHYKIKDDKQFKDEIASYIYNNSY
jgi:hypothetical protein